MERFESAAIGRAGLTNQDQNRQFRDAVRKIEETLGEPLSYSDRDRLHREVSGEQYDFEEIVELSVAMFG